MRKLLLLLTAGGLLAASLGCAYTTLASDPNGKVFMTRTNMGGFWNNSYVCEPTGGKLNCKEVTFEGTGGAPATTPPPGGEPAPAPPAPAPAGEGGGGEGGEGS